MLTSEIVELLKPWRPALVPDGDIYGPHKHGPHSSEKIHRYVHEQVTILRDEGKEHYTRESRDRTRFHAEEVLHTAIKLKKQVEDAIEHSAEMRARLRVLPDGKSGLLNWLDVACKESEAAIRQAGDRHHFFKAKCVTVALDFILRFSETRPTSYEGSNFRRIASLVYEAVSSEADCDLKRMCDPKLADPGRRAFIDQIYGDPANPKPQGTFHAPE
jgi:hypothetical protein